MTVSSIRRQASSASISPQRPGAPGRRWRSARAGSAGGPGCRRLGRSAPDRSRRRPPEPGGAELHRPELVEVMADRIPGRLDIDGHRLNSVSSRAPASQSRPAGRSRPGTPAPVVRSGAGWQQHGSGPFSAAVGARSRGSHRTPLRGVGRCRRQVLHFPPCVYARASLSGFDLHLHPHYGKDGVDLRIYRVQTGCTTTPPAALRNFTRFSGPIFPGEETSGARCRGPRAKGRVRPQVCRAWMPSIEHGEPSDLGP